MARPRKKLTKKHIAAIERGAALGLTQAEIADCLPVGERQLAARISGEVDDPEVSAAYARGRAMDADKLSSRHHQIAMGKIEAPVCEQRKALEWRLERQHKWAGRSVVEGDHVIRVEVTRRVAGAPTAAPGNRITAHTNGSGS